jgi:hypothetical protein
VAEQAESVTSVAHLIPAAGGRHLESAFSVVITSRAAALISPAALSTPVPIGSVRLPGVNPQQRGRIRGACHRHAVRLGIVDAVPARYMTMRRAAHVQAAAQHFRRQFGRELVAWPAEQVQRNQRLAAHRVDVRQGVGSSDPPERVSVIHHGSEEVGSDYDRHGRADSHHGTVVAMLDSHHQVRARAIGHEPGCYLL